MFSGCGEMRQERKLREEGITLLNSGSYSDAAEKFAAALKIKEGKKQGDLEKDIRSYLAEAFARISSLGAKTVVFGSGKSRSCPEGYEYGKAYRELKKVYRATGEEASRFGITVVIEPLSRKETNMTSTVRCAGCLNIRRVRFTARP